MEGCAAGGGSALGSTPGTITGVNPLPRTAERQCEPSIVGINMGPLDVLQHLQAALPVADPARWEEERSCCRYTASHRLGWVRPATRVGCGQ